MPADAAEHSHVIVHVLISDIEASTPLLGLGENEMLSMMRVVITAGVSWVWHAGGCQL